MRTAARTRLPVRAAWNSISSKSPTPAATLPTVPQRPFPIRPDLSAGVLKRIPEPAAQRMAHLVMEQEVNRQGRSPKPPGLKVRRHPGLPGKPGFQPQRGRVAGHRLAEGLALLVRRLHRVGEGNAGLAAGIAGRPARILLPGRRRGGHLAQRGVRILPLLTALTRPARLTLLTLLARGCLARPRRTAVGGRDRRLAVQRDRPVDLARATVGSGAGGAATHTRLVPPPAPGGGVA